jgi:hypothetical protein
MKIQIDCLSEINRYHLRAALAVRDLVGCGTRGRNWSLTPAGTGA